MPDSDIFYFQKLKRDLAQRVREGYPEVDAEIGKWKGREIQILQEDLEKEVNGRISEKWFYTHIKSEQANLPRIDILDLLSQYVGFKNWPDYKNANKATQSARKKIVYIFPVIMLFVFSGFVYIKFFYPRKYFIRVVDGYSNQSIHPDRLKVSQLFQDESPRDIQVDESGNYHFVTSRTEIKFVISNPYYHTDTIVRKIRKLSSRETIRLFPNDYALILQYLSNSNSEDWLNRRTQLNELIADNAMIFQVNDQGQVAMELYNKEEFINKLTIPVKSLGNIDIIDIRHEGEQISHLRFIQKKGDAHE